jgi:nucleoside-diphosphate-sugar epimerase
MKVLLIGGSGFVGKLIIPLMKERHQLRIFDLVPPADTTLEFVRGDVNDDASLMTAMSGMDAAVYLAMGKDEKGEVSVPGPAFDINAKGVYRACQAAVKSGVRRFVYASTMSIYEYEPTRRFETEDEPPDSTSVYGFTKALGEEVCRFFSRAHGLNCIALRLNGPVEQARWLQAYRQYPDYSATSGPDVARAFLSALDCTHPGFNAFFISGDFEGRRVNMSKAKKLLGWEPLQRPSTDRV